MTDWPSRIDRLKREGTCALRGHEKTWGRGFLGPTWQCSRCGKSGGLDEHSQMTLGQHLFHLTVAVVLLLVIGLVLRRLL